MPLKIFNSLSKNPELFQPIDPGKVRMYVCGPTVYDEPHIGHLRSAYVFEVIRNYLKYSGYQVTVVRNVTDVDDKIIEKASASGPADLVRATEGVSSRYFARYKEDLKHLGIADPDREPKATGHIPEMLALIEKLLKAGHAYASGGDVYFDVNSFQAYGKLSHQNKDALQQSVRIEKNEKKKDALDFALWKKAKEGEPAWDSPWGKGRPGWHIECSAMSMKYLGESFDIHGGGRDLIFPHHENEIAQSEAATGKTFAKYWMHHGLVTIHGEKMAKSLKNYVTLESLKDRINELKLLFLSTHYGAPLDYSEERMEMQRSVWRKFKIFMEGMGEGKSHVMNDITIDKFENKFKEAMDNDFNTPEALTVMHEMVHHANLNPGSKQAVVRNLRRMGSVLGLFGERDIRSEIKGRGDKLIQEKIIERNVARKNKDFKKADAIRQELLKDGIELVDQPDGSTSWRSV